MAKATARQRRTEGRVMHEFAHGELKSGRGGKGGKVKSRKQAIAIALNEAGASKFDKRPAKNRSSRVKNRTQGKPKGAPPSRSGKANRASVRKAAAKAPAPKAARMPAAGLPPASAPPAPACGAARPRPCSIGGRGRPAFPTAPR